MRGLFTPKNVDFGLSGQCFRLWLLETALLIFSTWNKPANFRYLEKLY